MIARLLFFLSALVVIQPNAHASDAQAALEKLTNAWRWSNYWFGRADVAELGEPNSQARVVLFWSRVESTDIVGLCASGPRLCFAYSGFTSLGSGPLQAGAGLLEAAKLSVQEGLGGVGPTRIGRTRIQVRETEFAELTIKVPRLDIPDAVRLRLTPLDAPEKARYLVKNLGCAPAGGNRGTGCEGSLVFSFYGPKDPKWFVLRSCSNACPIRGESVFSLSKGAFSEWVATVGGYIDSQEEVNRFKAKILAAEMIRLESER